MRYTYRRVPFSPSIGPHFIRLSDGDPISFRNGLGRDEPQPQPPLAAAAVVEGVGGGGGGGGEGEGPSPLLCTIHLALARVLRTSGAAEVVRMVMDEADDGDVLNSYIVDEESCDVLAAKLRLV